ncbi:LicD family protein [Polaromonas sp. OV174]|uniref:tetratricopeptide repeat protein n=1 Tax=Polaromonas sp. OV174 TaxID=1855300 RepID=UPI0008F33299|nr:tetratricopeptide repeat protein [Polaromonas sp. OV174]SFC17902.1 LicD family protein [Polaromonas sp. OV174]
MTLDVGCAQVRKWLQAGQAAQAWAALQQLAQAYPQQAVVPRLQGAVLSATGQHAQALAHYRAALALAPHDGLALAAAGGSLHLLGDLPVAMQHYRGALQSQCRAPLRMAASPPPPSFDSAAAEQRLWQVLAQLAGAGIHAFATAGTLLGLVREGRLLPFDKDLDIGLPFAQMQTATSLLLNSGWQRAAAPQGMVNPVMLCDGQGLSLDLCGLVAETGSGAALGGFWLQGVPADWQRVTQFPVLHLHQQPQPQGTVWTVTDPEAWLAALYGPDWRTPDPDFDTVIAAHNLRGFAVLTQCYAFSRIYEAWLQGRLQKAAALTSQSLRHLPDDALLLQVQQQLANEAPPAGEHALVACRL